MNSENQYFDLQIENHCTLYCDRVSVRLISGVRVAFNARGGAVLSSSRLRVQSFQKSVCLFLSLGWDIVCLHIPLFWEKKRLLFVLHVILQSQLNISWLSMLICLRQERNIFKKDLCIHSFGTWFREYFFYFLREIGVFLQNMKCEGNICVKCF